VAGANRDVVGFRRCSAAVNAGLERRIAASAFLTVLINAVSCRALHIFAVNIKARSLKFPLRENQFRLF
jgi:hypothetical protein